MLNKHHEPTGPIPLNGENSDEIPSFLREKNPADGLASIKLWLLAAASFVAYAAVNLSVALGNHQSTAGLIGMLVGSLFWPVVAIGISELWEENRTQKMRVKVFSLSSLALLLLAAGTFLSVRGFDRYLTGFDTANLTATDFKQRAVRCMQAQDLACAQENWAEYTKLRPTDGLGIVNLGATLNRRDEHKAAIAQFEKALDLGEGAYDLFAFYADSLSKLGRIDEAIDWSYKALSVAPMLADVRANLAKLLVARKRHYEALAVLQVFDAKLEGQGHRPYFTGQRITIETALSRDVRPAASGENALRLPTFEEHYYAPLTIGAARPAPFLVDTGASRTTMSDTFLDASKARYKITNPDLQLVTADGRKVSARAVTIEALWLGPFELKNVSVVTCSGCISLLGQSTLALFNMQSSKIQGVEFLTLVLRPI